MNTACKFCLIERSEKIIYETKNFIFLESKFPLIRGHCLLISKKHIRKEDELSKAQLNEAHLINKKAFNYIKRKYVKEPLVFINPPHQQSVFHFHRHFVPGVFGVNGVQAALIKYLKKNNVNQMTI